MQTSTTAVAAAAKMVQLWAKNKMGLCVRYRIYIINCIYKFTVYNTFN